MNQQSMAGFFFVPPSPDMEREDFRAALRHPQTRRIFRRLLASSNIMGPSLAVDGQNTAYNEGLRAVGLWLALKIETAAPGEVAALMQESGDDLMAHNLSHREK